MEKVENESWKEHNIKPRSEQLNSFENYHLKLWIGTIKGLSKHPSHENAAIFGHKTVAYVDVLGSVVNQYSYEKADIYVCMQRSMFVLSKFIYHFLPSKVDDGTGVISCYVKKTVDDLERIEQLRLASQNDSSIMVINK